MSAAANDAEPYFLAISSIDLRDDADVFRPRQSPSDPNLSAWRSEVHALIESTHAKGIVRIVVCRQSKDRAAAIATKRMASAGTAVGGFVVDARLATLDPKSIRRSRDGYAIRRSRQGLAIPAMANLDLGFIDFGLVFDLATVAASLDLHRALPSQAYLASIDRSQAGSSSIAISARG